jgi:transposase InsO family protein
MRLREVSPELLAVKEIAMLMNQQEFSAYCTSWNLSGPARALLERVRKNAPARRVGGGARNVTNRFASRKMGFTIQAESRGPEFSFVVASEYDQDVLEYYDQPETLRVSALSRKGKPISKPYTPDFLMLSKTSPPCLVECKSDEEIAELLDKDPNWRLAPDGSVSYEPLRNLCSEIGLQSRIVKSSELPERRIQNLLFLSDCYDEGRSPPSEEARAAIVATLDAIKWASRREILTRDPTIMADDLNWMIAHEELYVDIDNQVIADDIRTLIFRDQNAAQAYQAFQQGAVPDDALAIKSITLEPGTNVVWDGVRYEVGQVGETEVSLKNADGWMRGIRLNDVDDLIAKRKLLPDATASSTASAAAREVVLAASPADLAVALKQKAKLDGDPKYPPASTRTLERLRARFKIGIEKYGNGFLGLIPRISARGNRRPRKSQAVSDLMKEVVDELIIGTRFTTISACLGELRLQCKEQALAPPSEATFRTYVKCIRREIMEGAKKGHKAAHAASPWHISLTYKTPKHGQRPFEIGHIDHTELDLHFVDEAYGKRSLRAWLTVLIDAYSRKILAWHITFKKPSAASIMCVIRSCLERYNRGCDMYVVDQGADFNSDYFETLLARLGAHKRERPAGKARYGSLIERFFGVATQEFIRQLVGCNHALKDPRSLAPSHDPRNNLVWTLREFTPAWEGWLNEFYHKVEHGTLGASPDLVFEEGLRRFGHQAGRRIVFDDTMRVLCLPGVKTEGGLLTVEGHLGHVRVHGGYYLGEVLQDPKLHRRKVPARYDPFDISRLYVYVHRKWHELRAQCAGDIEGMSLDELKIYTEELMGKNSQQYERRKTRQETLAAYLRKVRATEERQRQEAKDRQTQKAAEAEKARAQNAKNTPPAAAQSAQHAEPFEFDVNAHWEKALQEAIGEQQ